MPLFETRDERAARIASQPARSAGVSPVSSRIRQRRRDWLTGKLVSVRCPACGTAPAGSCDFTAETGDDLIQLNRDPELFAHATRIADALTAHPAIRRLAMAQFEQGTAPACLTAPAPEPKPPAPASEPEPARRARYDPAGYRSSARRAS
jgi:hypothetical protein